MTMDDRWLSVDEIAEYLGVSRDTIYNWIAKRGMPAHRIGRFWKFKIEAVDKWVQSGGADAIRRKSRKIRKKSARNGGKNAG